MENSILKRKVMFRIYTEYLKHLAFRYWERLLIAVIAADIFIFVSVRSVYENIPKDSAMNSFNYLLSSVRKTEIFLQLALGYVIIRALFPLIRAIYRNLPKLGKNLRLIKA